MSHEPSAKCDDETTWHHKDQKLNLSDLLGLIEQHGGPDGLDLHGCDLSGVDLSYQALLPFLQGWRGSARPPWVYGVWGINLSGAHLEYAKFSASNLQGADLSLCRLAHTFFFGTRLDKASLVRALASEVTLLHASAREAALQNAQLDDATLMATDFRHSQFGGASLRRARLRDSNFGGVDLRLTDLAGTMLHGAVLEKTRIRPGNLGWHVGEELSAAGKQTIHYKVSHFDAADVYRDLKANFASLGYYDEASWAYIKQKQMEKMAAFHLWRPRVRLAWFTPIAVARASPNRRRKLLRWLLGWPRRRATRVGLRRWSISWIYELLTGYGERPILPVAWSVVIILGFTLVHTIDGNIAPEFSGDPATARGSHDVLHALTHSIGAFATIGFNTLEPIGRAARLLTAIESALGILFYALFVFTLGNRISRS